MADYENWPFWLKRDKTLIQSLISLKLFKFQLNTVHLSISQETTECLVYLPLTTSVGQTHSQPLAPVVQCSKYCKPSKATNHTRFIFFFFCFNMHSENYSTCSSECHNYGSKTSQYIGYIFFTKIIYLFVSLHFFFLEGDNGWNISFLHSQNRRQ